MSEHHEHHKSSVEPHIVRRIIGALIFVCLTLLIIGEIDAIHHKHGEFEIEFTLPGFYAAFGALAYFCIIAGAVGLRKIVMRPEDYYDD